MCDLFGSFLSTLQVVCCRKKKRPCPPKPKPIPPPYHPPVYEPLAPAPYDNSGSDYGSGGSGY